MVVHVRAAVRRHGPVGLGEFAHQANTHVFSLACNDRINARVSHGIAGVAFRPGLPMGNGVASASTQTVLGFRFSGMADYAMSKPFLVIQLRPEDATADSEFDKILQYGELMEGEVVRLRVETGEFPEIHLDQYAAIIVGGSPFDVSTEAAEKPSLQNAIEEGFGLLFEDLIRLDFPFLGCCSGSGLLGNFLGAPVSRKYAEPVGATEVSLTEAGREDPLLTDLPDPFRVLTGHKEAVDRLPEEAVLLASNSQCPVQMFRVRQNIYATQFHPEGDPEGFTVRINVYRNHGYFPPASAERLIEAVAHEHTPDAHRILQRFVQRYRQAG